MKSVPLNFTSDMPRTDYPRPQWVRSQWLCLNGVWEFAYDVGNSGKERGMVEQGEFPMTIVVPFCPESRLSGIGNVDFIPAVWYRRTLQIDSIPGARALMHFGAVDYECDVWVNGKHCGSHKGGYSSFTIEITDALTIGDNVIIIYAQDDLRSYKQPYGKQSYHYASKACSYTRTTGIWQTVWLEFVGQRYLTHARMIPSAADSALNITVFADNAKPGDQVRMKAYYNGRCVGSCNTILMGQNAATRIEISETHLWAPGAPELYELTLELLDRSGNILDTVESYFALRDVSLSKRALMINGKPVFMRLILDQGFNPEGIYTAPSDDFIRRDIELSMALGFNGARLHQRVFEERTLFWADKLGYIVWSEYANGNALGTAEGIEHFLPEWMEVMQRDFNHPAIIGWCAFNETYHDHALNINTHCILYNVTKALDPTRPVIDASGGMHYDTDMFDVHDYQQDPEIFRSYFAPMAEDSNACHVPISRYVGTAPRRPIEYKGQPYWVSEYGGTFWNPAVTKDAKGWGYGDAPSTEDEFADRYERLTDVLLSHPRICGFCYTQLTDIEQEQNGLYFYDRTRKFSNRVYDRIHAANTAIAEVEKE
jgi:beta-galactosidase/beta-glucuronidase